MNVPEGIHPDTWLKVSYENGTERVSKLKDVNWGFSPSSVNVSGWELLNPPPTFPEVDLSGIPLDDLEFSVRTHRLLKDLGVTNAQEVLGVTRDVFLGAKGAGRKSWNEIDAFQLMFRKPDPNQLWQELYYQVREIVVYGANIDRLRSLEDKHEELRRALLD